MILYHVLRPYFEFVLSLDLIAMIIIALVIIGVGILFGREIRQVLMIITIGPIGAYLVCEVAEYLKPLPLLGTLAWILQIGLDIAVFGTVIVVVVMFLRAVLKSAK